MEKMRRKAVENVRRMHPRLFELGRECEPVAELPAINQPSGKTPTTR
jgi:hypothetical protein